MEFFCRHVLLNVFFELLTFFNDQLEVMFVIIEPSRYLQPAAVPSSIWGRDVQDRQGNVTFVQSAQ